MENKKKMAFNVVFLILVFAGTIYGVFHGGRSWRDCEDIEDRESAVAHSRIYMRDRIYMGRIHHYLLYDENSWNQKEKSGPAFCFRLLDFSLVVLRRLLRGDSLHRFII